MLKALYCSAFFIALLALGLLPSAYARAMPCAMDRLDAEVQVRYVFDGDTVQLADGRKLRFVGINTPERSRDNRPAQAYASEASQAVRELLVENPRLRLRFDVQREDRYGRILAHPYLADGRSLTQLLLERGLGAAIVIPPNEWQSNCYYTAERTARALGRGQWADPRFQVYDAHLLPAQTRGFYLVRGRVQQVSESRKSFWLDLSAGFSLRVAKKDLHNFSVADFSALLGRKVIARGWIYYYGQRLRMQIRHPLMLQILAEATPH